MAKPGEIQPLGLRGSLAKFMLVAPPGFGKTVFGASGDNVLFITTDPEGTESAYFLGMQADEWVAQTAAEVRDAYSWLRDGGAKEYDWLVIDNIGQVQKQLVREAIDLDRAKKPHLDEFVPSQANYQRSQLALERLVMQFNELPINVLWTCHQEKNYDDEGDIFYSPAIHGQKGAIAQSIAGLMKIVGYGEEVEDGEEIIRRIWFTKHGPFRGKDRYTVLGPYRDDFTLKKLDTLIERKRQEVASPAAPVARKTTTPAARAKRVATTRRK